MDESATNSVAPQTQPNQALPIPTVPQRQPTQISVNDSKVLACYANFCRITGTPEEILLDVGLNPQPVGTPTQPIVISERIVMNFYTAKRLLYALQQTVLRHESVFGVIETDIQKRVHG